MARLGIALDLGTSGFRGQAIDLDDGGRILSTAVTTRHPFPGANVIDHLHFALEVGVPKAHEIVVHAVNKVLDNLRIDSARVVCMAVCGNPIQLSLFQGIEIRDLAYAGKRKLEALHVVPPKRDAHIVKARDIRELSIPGDADVLIPPAVRHEIGADALAMMIQTGMLDKDEIAIVTDYGTNAEMALIVKGTVYTGSTAAGPALEGQQIKDGILALPGAISDVAFETDGAGDAKSCKGPGMGADCQPQQGRLRTWVLDQEMIPRAGDTVDPTTGRVLEKGDRKAVGITGTGVIALLSQGLNANLIRIPRITTADTEIHLPDDLVFAEEDLLEAGKAIGAVRAGHITLCQEAGITLEDIETAYMSGASGTYVDALKAQAIGMIPARVKRIYQVGNTSLAMARDMVRDVSSLWNMQSIADNLRQNHCMFAESKVFEKVYILELSYWTEGMPLDQYQRFLQKYGFPRLADITDSPEVIKTVERDIPDLGVMGLSIISDIGERKMKVFERCAGDAACVLECPEKALQMKRHGDRYSITINLALCDGMACRRCERVCPEKTLDLVSLITSGGPSYEPEEPPAEMEAGTAATGTDLDEAILDALSRVPGIVQATPLRDEDRAKILELEEEAEARSLMGLGKVINAGIREVLDCDRIYVGFTDMEFNWSHHPNLLMKKDGEVVGQEVTNEEARKNFAQDKNVWFMHKSFVVFKSRVSFPQDVMEKICHFEIPCHPTPEGWGIMDQAVFECDAAIYGSPSTLCDVFLKERYFRGIDEKGSGTILIGVKVREPIKEIPD